MLHAASVLRTEMANQRIRAMSAPMRRSPSPSQCGWEVSLRIQEHQASCTDGRLVLSRKDPRLLKNITPYHEDTSTSKSDVHVAEGKIRYF